MTKPSPPPSSQPSRIDSTTLPDVDDVKAWIRAKAYELGFADCGFLSVHHPLFAEQTRALKVWLNQGLHGTLDFMHDNHELRANPHKLVDGAKTIISVRMDYLHTLPAPRRIEDNERPNHAIIARYARGEIIIRPSANSSKNWLVLSNRSYPIGRIYPSALISPLYFGRLVIRRRFLSARLPMPQGLAGQVSILC